MQPRKLLILSVTAGALAALVALFALMSPATAAPATTGQFTALLDGAQETPPVSTAASGVGRFTLSDDNTLTYEIAVRDIDNVTLAHIHLGAPGVAGAPVFTLYDGTGDFDPGNPISGTLDLTAGQVDDLLAGDYYVNVHTTEYPAGEIRGQLAPATTLAFGAMLSGANEVPPVDNPATGQAFATLSADMTQLHFRVLVADIAGITAAHFHEAPPGANGPVVIPIFTGGGVFDEANPASGVITPTVGQVAALLAGDYYVNVHTSANPAGAIRGQVAAVTPRLDYHALMTGGEEVPPVATDAAGLGTFALSADLSTLDFRLAVADIADITAAHLHTGWPGRNGGVAHTLYAGGGTFDPDNPVDGQIPLDAGDVLDLWSGYYYANVHTTANPAGAIRGQVEGASLFGADLNGIQEVPPVTTNAGGRAVLALSDDATTLYYRVMVRDIDDITASHIHLGATGVNGPVVFPLFTGTGDFDPDNPISGSIPLAEENVLDLIAGNYYINVHTTDHPGGEIRGQVGARRPPSRYGAVLEGDQEVPPVTTDARGEGRFTLDGGRGTLHYHVSVRDIDNITASHIHRAPAGVNGPVVIPLYTGGGAFDPDNPIGGGATLDAEGLVDLLTGYYYVNVHTTDYPAGEIRGQIGAGPAAVWMPVIVP